MRESSKSRAGALPAAAPASVAFLDLVLPEAHAGYPKQLLLELLEAAERHKPAADEFETLLVPALDGVFLVFPNKNDGKLPNAVPTALVEMISKLMTDQLGNRPGQELLRCGIDYGDTLTVPNGPGHPVGYPFEQAYRLASQSITNQVLLTAEFRQALGKAWSGRPAGWVIGPAPIEYLDKINELQVCLSLSGTHDGRSFGTPRVPAELWKLEIEPPLSAYSPQGLKKRPPKELMLRHMALAFVGATHKNLARSLAEVSTKYPKKRWDKILVFFLHPGFLSGIEDSQLKGADPIETQQQSRHAIQNLRESLGKRVSTFRTFEFDIPYFFGSFWDWEKKGGRIHVSPYVWGQSVSKCPAVDYVRRGDEPSEIFETYVKGLDWLEANSTVIGQSS